MKIHFKPVELVDIELLRLHRNQPLTHRWLEFEGVITKERQKQWFESGSASSFRLILDGNNKIGVARIKEMPNKFIQVGMDLFEDFRGKKLALLVFHRLIQEFKNSDNSLELWVFLDNTAAVKTYLKSGFIFDTSSPLKFFLRSWDSSNKAYPYARMLFF